MSADSDISVSRFSGFSTPISDWPGMTVRMRTQRLTHKRCSFESPVTRVALTASPISLSTGWTVAPG